MEMEIENLKKELTRERKERERLMKEKEVLLREREELGQELKRMREQQHDQDRKVADKMSQMEEQNMRGMEQREEMMRRLRTLENSMGAVGGKAEERELREDRKESIGENGMELPVQKSKGEKGKKKEQTKAPKAVVKSVSIDDSLYSSSASESEKGSSESDVGEVKTGGLVIREIPTPSKFNVYGSRDIEDFFREFEGYCKAKYSERMGHWVKVLGECLEGRMYEFWKVITGEGNVKYEVVKSRMIEQVGRIKGSVRYQKKDDFERASMKEGESIDGYAHRLETVARRKYGNENIEGCKPLIKKFLETVPGSVREYLNMKRKEYKRSGGQRLLWGEILELLEDRMYEERKYGESEWKREQTGRVNVGMEKTDSRKAG